MLDLQCVTASSLYIEGDDGYDPAKILVDTNVTYDVGQPCKRSSHQGRSVLTPPDHGEWKGDVQIDVYIDNNQLLTKGSAKMNQLGTLIPFDTTDLGARKENYNITCKATIDGQTFYARSKLAYLPPNPYGGNTVKLDRASGALMVRNETAGTKEWERIIPFGFYDVRLDGVEPVRGADARRATIRPPALESTVKVTERT